MRRIKKVLIIIGLSLFVPVMGAADGSVKDIYSTDLMQCFKKQKTKSRKKVESYLYFFEDFEEVKSGKDKSLGKGNLTIDRGEGEERTLESIAQLVISDLKNGTRKVSLESSSKFDMKEIEISTNKKLSVQVEISNHRDDLINGTYICGQY